VSNGAIKPDYALGHSLGEYSALYTAGVMDLDTTLKAIQKRADLMQMACESSKQGGMSAILGLSEEKIKEALKEASSKGLVGVANYNEPNQIVITGEIDAVNYANELIKEAGAKRVEIKQPVFQNINHTELAQCNTQTIKYGGLEYD